MPDIKQEHSADEVPDRILASLAGTSVQDVLRDEMRRKSEVILRRDPQSKRESEESAHVEMSMQASNIVRGLQEIRTKNGPLAMLEAAKYMFAYIFNTPLPQDVHWRDESAAGRKFRDQLAEFGKAAKQGGVTQALVAKVAHELRGPANTNTTVFVRSPSLDGGNTFRSMTMRSNTTKPEELVYKILQEMDRLAKS